MEKLRQLMKPLAKKGILIALAVAAAAVVSGMIVVDNLNTYTVVDGWNRISVTTFATDPEEVLAGQNIVLASADTFTVEQEEGSEPVIRVNRAFPVKVTADGKTVNLMVLGGKVKDALSKADVTVGKDDLLNLDLDRDVVVDDEIIVQRVTYKTTKKTETIEYKTVEKKDSSLEKGKTKVVTEGKNGKKEITYQEKYIDGKLTETKKVKTTVKEEAVDKVVAVGTKVEQAKSTAVTFPGATLNANGVPVKYKKLIKGVAAAYSAPDGAKTASGRIAKRGHVAVNPNVIPYGTKLYITTSDGSYVYGYAIAADTGTALRDGIIDVDLFYETNEECCQFGKRNVNIYVLS